MLRFIPVLGLLALAAGAGAQLSLTSAVDIALQNSPRIKMAQADVARAQAALQETKDTFIPSVGISGGVGRSSGPPLAVPQVFTVSAQSLVFNFSVRDYIRAAHASLAAAQLSLEEARNGVTEDVVNTYLGLDFAVQRQRVGKDALTAAHRLEEIIQARFEAGIEPHVEVSRSRRTGLQIERMTLTDDDEVARLSEHLSSLVGIRLTGQDAVHSSVPAEFPTLDARVTGSPALQAAEANAINKFYVARAQSRYLLRPQFTFGANYSYINTAFTNYDLYYRAFTQSANSNPNALSLGVQIQIPLLDYAHRARTREAMAEAARARWEVEDARNVFREGNGSALRGRRQLALGAELARVERDLAKDELDTVLVRLQPAAGAAGGPQMSPRDEQNVRLQVQQRTLDMLNAELQLEQTEVTLMRQDGTLAVWLKSAPTGLSPAVSVTPVSPGKP